MDSVLPLLKESKEKQCIVLLGNDDYAKMKLVERFTSSDSIRFINAVELSSGNELETLQRAIRQSLIVELKENAEFITGEVVTINIERTATSSSARIVMRTLDMESAFDFGSQLTDELQRTGVNAGDIVEINRLTGAIAKLGRSNTRLKEYDVHRVASYIEIPSGELISEREHVTRISLHELDVLNSSTRGFQPLLSGEYVEVSRDVRKKVDESVTDWMEEGKATLVRGSLCIKEASAISKEACVFLCKIVEDAYCPYLFLFTEKLEYESDFSSRALIILVEALRDEEIREALAKIVSMDDGAFDLAIKMYKEHGYNYISSLLCTLNEGTVLIEQLKEASRIFLPA